MLKVGPEFDIVPGNDVQYTRKKMVLTLKGKYSLIQFVTYLFIQNVMFSMW